MHTTKKGQERRNRILDEATALFAVKGYEQTTVADILEAVGMGKGTFYHYFAAKEDVLDAIVRRRCDEGVEAAARIAADPAPDARVKLLKALLAQKSSAPVQERFIEVLHEKGNALLHQKCMTELVLRLSPVLGGIVEQGVREGVFSTPYPRESMEFLVALAMTVFDDGYFAWTHEELERKMHALLLALERTLGAEEGTLSSLTACFDNV